MRILYLPIIESGQFHETALINKRGLLDALRERADVYQLDYLAVPKAQLFGEVLRLIEEFKPDMMITQLHGADCLYPHELAAIRAKNPHVQIINWSGDSWKHSLISPAMLELCRQFDLQLVASPDVLPVYAENGIKAAYWQIAYEYPAGDLPNMPSYDVVFMGNVIADRRREMLQFLRSLEGINVGIYGDWQHADGHNTYNFGEGEALYKNAKIAIADNVYPDSQNYISNRPFQILMAGGAVLLHQHVPAMERLAGLIAGVHYVEWVDFDELERLIRGILAGANVGDIVEAGKAHVMAHHTYKSRVDELFDVLIPEVSRA